MTEPQPSPSDDLQKKLAAVEAEAKTNHDKYLRALAELENFRKRAAKDQEDHSKFGQERLIREFVAVLDDFDRVLEHLPKTESPEIKTLVDGVHLIHRHFWNVLKKHGLEEIQTEQQKFDPHWHESIGQLESTDQEEGTILQCHRKGYRLHHRLLRASLVTIAKKPANETKS